MLVCIPASASELTPVCFIHVCSASKKRSRYAKNWFHWMKYNVFPADIAQNLLNLVLISSMYNAEAYAAIRGNVKNSHVAHRWGRAAQKCIALVESLQVVIKWPLLVAEIILKLVTLLLMRLLALGTSPRVHLLWSCCFFI